MSQPASLYIHIPWCTRRCGYCDFNTYVTDTADASVTTPYIDALVAELHQAGRTLEHRRVATVYFGGGTPTLMPPAGFRRILAVVRDEFEVDGQAEVTTEANPETLSPGRLAELRDAGVNRLSMGMQSAVPRVLATLDRLHTPGRTVDAVAWARAAGFENLSLDLIYGTPGESMADWEQSVSAALAAHPEHLSAYSLIVEDRTPLARRMAAGQLAYPDDEDLADKYIQADELFAAAGLAWYEVSNWAKPGFECRHNLAYWRGADWWGIGAGAHSHVGQARWWNYRHPGTYADHAAAGAARAGGETLTPAQRHAESVMLAMRLADGVDAGELTPAELARAAGYIGSGHLVRHGSRLVCTLPGRLIADRITRDVLD